MIDSHTPLSEPHRWDDDEEGGHYHRDEERAFSGDSRELTPGGGGGAAAMGTGLARIQKLAQTGVGVSDGARDVLAGLLRESGAWHHGATVEDMEEAAAGGTPAAAWGAGACGAGALDPLSYDVPTSDLVRSGASVSDLAREGRLSLFGSILRLFRDEAGQGGEVSTPNVVRACSHALRPADVPPDMDAKEAVMAALHFLSSPVPGLDAASDGGRSPRSCDSVSVGDLFPSMPLLVCTNADDNLDRRCYVKHVHTPDGNWSMGDTNFRRKVIRLERAFAGSTEYNPSRLRMCPRVEDREAEAKLMASGTLPAASKAKTGASSKKKKGE